MRPVRWLIVLLAAALSLLLGASSAEAQPRLPYQAYGSGLSPNATIEAVRGEAVLSSTRADAEGNWMLQVPPDTANDGDIIGFRVNGRLARETVTFRSARFAAPPGLTLTVEGQPPATGAPGASDAASSTPVLLWGAILGVIVVVAVGAGVVVLRRRGVPR